MEEISLSDATGLYESLPAERRIATLAPAYVVADAGRDPCLHPVFVARRSGADFWLHAVHRARIPGETSSDFQSAYGYGGPVSSPGFRLSPAEIWREYAAWCRTHGVVAEFVRLHPMASEWQVYGGEVHEDRATVVMDVSVPDIRAGYEVRSRTAVRKAEKFGLEVVAFPSSEIGSRFASFYREGMARLGADDFYLFGDEYFSRLAGLNGIRLLVCRRIGDDEWMSAGLFLAGALTLEYHLSATTEEGRACAATNLLIDAAARVARESGLHWLYLGGGTDRDPSNALLRFKAGFSRLRKTFRVGRAIHDMDLYADIATRMNIQITASTRVLFYR